MKTTDSLADYMHGHRIEAEFLLLPSGTRTVAQAAAALEVAPEQIVKSLLFYVKSSPVLVIASGTGRVDTARLAAYFGLTSREVRLATAEEVLQITGFEIGSVPPIGHDPGLHTLLDPAVLAYDAVYAGGGAPDHLVRISPEIIVQDRRAQVVDLQSVL
ncbi:MAG: YbaK/EbsC family protein [Anaerolineales bacterium]|jgi:prolyl-tRNA editing enzyme YbaK/EbsC (Cys-tRNA(Pro) deacylase)